MSRRESQEAQDHEFESILIKLEPYLSNLPASENSRLCRLWLKRLDRAHDQRNLRNDYLFELYKQLKNGSLSSPFNEPPINGRLIPISNCHRLVTSSSCNELTETTLSPCEQKRRTYLKPRSKSLRRGTTRYRNQTPTRQFDVHSSSSPNRISHLENSSVTSPTAHHYESIDNRNLLSTYHERIERLGSLVQDLEGQNEKLKQKLTYYHNALDSSCVPRLHARIKQLMAEIVNLKSKLKEVEGLKAVLENRHKDIVKQYKKKLTEQFNTMKKELENVHAEKETLSKKLDLFEQKLRESSHQNDDDKEWGQKIEEYEKILREKNEEIKKKGDLVHQKELELSQKLSEISSLNQKIKELQQTEGQSKLAEQYESMKLEMSAMIQSMENAARKQNESQEQEISALKRNFQKLEKLTRKFATRELERAIVVGSQMWLQDNYYNNPMALAFLDKQSKIADPVQIFDIKYKELLNYVESFAETQRSEFHKRLQFLQNQIARLQKG